MAFHRLQMIMELKDSEERLKTIFEASPIPVVVFSPKGQVEMWNTAAEKTYSWKKRGGLENSTLLYPRIKGKIF
ncbi:MAG: PAS domain S-box protein [Clostridia bacterium]|nr:PAS domain S-box protein [Clostridia bacterium]